MRCARAASAWIRTVSTRRWRISAPKRGVPGRVRAKRRPTRCGLRCARELGATEFLGYDTEAGRRHDRCAIVKDGARVEAAKAGETVRHSHQPDAVLWRIGRAGRAITARCLAKGGEGSVIDTEKKLGALHVHVVEIDARHIRRWAMPSSCTSMASAARATRANHSATHLLHARTEARAGAACVAEGFARGARPAAVRFQPSQSRLAGRT